MQVARFLRIAEPYPSGFESCMRVVSILAAFALFGCAAGHRLDPAFAAMQVPQRVTALAAYGSGALPAPYRRPHDGLGLSYVFFSYERLCVVDARAWTTTQVGDLVSCEWRSPR